MKLRPFELTVVIIFIVLAIFALIMISTYDGNPTPEEEAAAAIGNVSIWGTIPAAGINQALFELAEENEAYRNVSYKYFAPERFDDALTNALADGVGPDIVLISQEKLVNIRQRIRPFSYESFPERDIRNLYLDGAQIFALPDGMYGFPVAVDPLVMYWNRDTFATEGYLEAPQTWEALINGVFDDLIQRDFDRTIRRAVVAMGEYGNVRNSFGILSTLFIQGGSELVTFSYKNEYQVKLQSTVGGKGDPFRTAADFYTRFSQPSNTLYSWNRAFTEDRREFVAEDLAIYFGFGSEGPQLEQINPNLNFDIAEVPQGASATVRRTYGKFYALSLLRSSDNPSGAAIVLSNLGSSAIADKIALQSDMAPVYRSSIAAGSDDTYGRITYQAASIALGWLNPELSTTDGIFTTMTQDINENRRELGEAVGDAARRLQNAY